MKTISKKELKELIDVGTEQFNELLISEINLEEYNLNNVRFNKCEFTNITLIRSSLDNIQVNVNFEKSKLESFFIQIILKM